MSLEALLKANTAAMEANTAALLQVLSGANAGAESAPADEKKTTEKKATDKKTTAKAADAGDGDGDGDVAPFDALKNDLGKWLGEFSKAEDKTNPDGVHPEVTARREAIKNTLKKLKADVLADIAADDKKIAQLHKWLNDVAIPVDKGHGKGRLVADPDEAGGDSDLGDI